MSELILEEWRNSTRQVRYPFSDRATLVNSDGIRIDEQLFDDARLYPAGARAGLFVSSIVVADNTITFNFSDLITGLLASATYTFGSAAALIKVVDIYGRPAGVLVSDADRLSTLSNSFGEGTFQFEQSQTELAATVVVPTPAVGLRGFLLDDGNIVSADVTLVGSNGIVLSVEDGAIRIDAIGDPYARLKDCEERGFVIPRFCGLRTINQIPPDAQGDFKILPGSGVAADNILRVEQNGTGTLIIKPVRALGLTNNG